MISGVFTESIARQSGCIVDFKCVFDTGEYKFGLSGNSGILDFYVKNNEVFDKDRRFIYSAQHATPIKLSYLINDSKAISYVNDEPVSWVSTIPSFDYFYSSGSNEYENSYVLSGKLPRLQYSGISSFDDGIDLISGAIINLTPERIFKIKSIDVLPTSSAQIYVSGWDSGNISQTGLIYISSDAEPYLRTGLVSLAFDTNFGDFQLDINVDTNAANEEAVFEFFPLENFYSLLDTQTYVIEASHNFGNRLLDISMDFLSGGIKFPYEIGVTGLGTGHVTGNIYMLGNLTGAISGLLPENTYKTGLVSVPYIVTGNFTGNALATLSGEYSGSILYEYNHPSGFNINLNSGNLGYYSFGQGTGTLTGIYSYFSGSGAYESFINVNKDIFSSYPFWTGHYNRTISSGIADSIGFLVKLNNPLEYHEDVFVTDSLSITISNDYDATSAYFSISSGDGSFSGINGGVYFYTGLLDFTYLNTSGGLTLQAAGNFEYTGNLTGVSLILPVWRNVNVSITGTGNFGSYSASQSGIYRTFTSGLSGVGLVTTGKINHYDIWGISTGQSFLNLLNFKNNGWYNTGKYIHSGANAYLPEEFSSIVIQVDYDGSQTSGVNVARINYSDGILSGNLLISGTGLSI